MYSLATGQGPAADTESSFFGNVNEQVRISLFSSLLSERRRYGLPISKLLVLCR